MEFSPFNILKLVLPSICILYSLACPTIGNERVFHEVYQNADYQLSLDLETNPEGYFQKIKSNAEIFFSGVFVHGDKEEEVLGTRVVNENHPYYIFSYGKGQFIGELKNHEGGCEGALHFSVSKDKKMVQEGVLKAGICF